MKRHRTVFLQRQRLFAQYADTVCADIKGTHGELAAVAARQGGLDAQRPARNIPLVYYVKHKVSGPRWKNEARQILKTGARFVCSV
ncbi:MAG: hypothetical protein ACRYHA_31155 [Janthinobacterium lividum]